MAPLKSTVVRDFGGGLNVVDDDLNLSATFQPVLDNVHRGVDNTLSVRWGTELFMDLRRGSVFSTTVAFTVSWTIGLRSLVCDYPAHGLQDGDHVTFTAGWSNMFGLNSAEIIGVPLGVRVTSPNQFVLVARSKAAATSSDALAKAITKDTHFLAGDILEMVYYDDHLIVFDSAGEIVKINAAMTTTRIWDSAKAFVAPGQATGGPGWTAPIDYVSTAIFKGKLIACNGVDKPLYIDLQANPNVVYLGDPAGGSFDTTYVPVCRYVTAIDRWLVMAGDPVLPYKVHISGQDAPGVWEHPDGTAPDIDATSLELNNTNSASIYIRGINKFRNFLAVAFDDTVAMVELGIYDGNHHKPEVSDSVARHGSVAHKSMVFLGFDLIMADPIGIPSFAKSQFDNSIIPSRMSELIAPLLQQNISRLTAITLERDLFSVYSTHDNRYILFVPNHDDVPMRLPNDPIYYLAALLGTDRALLNVPNHGMEEGDQFTLSNSVDPLTDIPNPCIVDTVVNKDVITFRINTTIIEAKNYGGSAVNITKKRTETTAYAFTYNKGLKIKAWSRYRGWNFRAGTTSLYGRVFLADKSKIWRMGNRFDPIYADFRGVFDTTWTNNTAYTTGQKVRDPDTHEVWICMTPHTSPTENPFETYREEFPDNWELYRGIPIKFNFEFPWADFDKRDLTKIMKTINVDAKGTDRFTVEMFLDYFYKNKITGDRTPQLQMDMVGGDKGTYGVYRQNYGAGRIAIRQRPWPFEARGKLFKLRVHGATIEALRFVAFIFGYKLIGRDR